MLQSDGEDFGFSVRGEKCAKNGRKIPKSGKNQSGAEAKFGNFPLEK
jgi:hypothetical protein